MDFDDDVMLRSGVVDGEYVTLPKGYLPKYVFCGNIEGAHVACAVASAPCFLVSCHLLSPECRL